MNPIVLCPSSSGSTSRVLGAPSGFTTSVTNAAPIGKVLINIIGGVDTTLTSDEDSKTSEYDSRINIPAGINPRNLDKFTLYDCLGLGAWTDCTELGAIKRAYNKAVLVYHPDKQPFYDKNGAEDRTVFLKMQLGFNTLCDTNKRRAYDSQLPFDEHIPSDDFIAKALEKGPEKYLRVYDKVFKRNARFAVVKPVPDIGLVDTPINDVINFYEYWTNFESWRDFTGMGAEKDPDSAQDRYAKRMMQKENEKLAKKLKTKEMQRIINLVTRAKQFDPRILQEKEDRRLAKENKLKEREAAARKEEDAKKALEVKAEEVKVTSKGDKMAKEKERKLASKVRSTTKKLMRKFNERCATMSSPPKVVSEYGPFSYDDIEVQLCTKCPREELTSVCDWFGGEMASKDDSTHMNTISDGDIQALIERTSALIEECKSRPKA